MNNVCRIIKLALFVCTFCLLTASDGYAHIKCTFRLERLVGDSNGPLPGGATNQFHVRDSLGPHGALCAQYSTLINGTKYIQEIHELCEAAPGTPHNVYLNHELGQPYFSITLTPPFGFEGPRNTAEDENSLENPYLPDENGGLTTNAPTGLLQANNH